MDLPQGSAIQHQRCGPTAGTEFCVIGEGIAGLPDEGVTKSSQALVRSLRRHHQVTMVSVMDRHAKSTTAHSSTVAPASTPHWTEPAPAVRTVVASRTFLDDELRRELEVLAPEVLIYIARSSTTFMAFVRSRVLRMYVPRATHILMGLQRRRHPRWQQRLLPLLKPDMVCVQSDDSAQYLGSLGCPVSVLSSGIDLDLFAPVNAVRRLELRRIYGLPLDGPIALHVGHLKAGRGVRALSALARTGACTVAMVASSSTAQEHALGAELSASGVRLFTGYLPHVEHLYQLSDCYVFPVTSTDNSIEVPLSVLEAFACDLPVVTTEFGGLLQRYGAQPRPDGLVFAATPDELLEQAARMCSSALAGHGNTRALALPYAWETIADHLLMEVMNVVHASPAKDAVTASSAETKRV